MLNFTKSSKKSDSVDQWLEARGYYRKHTARDSTCLFRAFSEQLFLTQVYHEKVRADCVRFMQENAYLFEKDVECLEEYIEAMSGVDAFGGPLEIRAMSKLYQCEVFIFEKTSEPVNMTKNGFAKRVFLFHADKHYDSVFYKSYIHHAAFCQSLVYEILYERVFKLPDVQYAVSKMLSKTSNINELKSENLSQDTLVNKDSYEWVKKEPEADPNNTCCVLEEVSKCMFHSRNSENANVFIKKINESNDELGNGKNQTPDSNFSRKCFKDCDGQENNCCKDNLEADANNNRNENNNPSMIPEFVARFLNLTDFHATDPNISCVKQMLEKNLTPFPYKVAKVLDPDIYRNIEFDTWNEIRRELRYGNWYNDGTKLQVGVKCLVKITENQMTWYHCHIQEMPSGDDPCIVFVEELGEKRAVPRDFLQPLPLEQVKPWALPYRHYRNLVSTIQNSKFFSFSEYNNKIKKSRVCKFRKVQDMKLSNNDNTFDQYFVNKSNPQKAKINNLQDISTSQCKNDIEIIPTRDDPSPLNNSHQKLNTVTNESFTGVIYNNEVQSSYLNTPTSTYSCPTSYVWPVNQINWNNVPDYFQSQNYGICDQGTVSLQVQGASESTQQESINYSAPKSILLSGADLPLHDTPTLRFFYNIGVDCFNSSCFAKQPFKEIEMGQDGITPSIQTRNLSETIIHDCNNPDELCIDFHGNLILEDGLKNSNKSLIENHFGNSCASKIISMQTTNPSESGNKTISNGNINISNNIKSDVINGDAPQFASPYVVTYYTQVPGMYSTMVPCYPLEESNNLYVAQYMGMPFGVIPQNSDTQTDAVQDQNYPVPPSQVIYQSNPSMPCYNQHVTNLGYYQNQVWYPMPTNNTASTQPVILPEENQHNNCLHYSSNNNTV